MQRRHRGHLKAALVAGAWLAAASIGAPSAAQAQGFFDFLFGGPQRPAPPPTNNYPPPPPAGIGRIAPAPLGSQERVNGGEASTGHGVAYCVRLCDGQHFPIERITNGTPADTCKAICPHSSTKVFFGNEINAAVAQDGQSYTGLQTAFMYRKQLVANCTCNGRDAFGLVSFDVKNDPTLRPGDIVSTRDGLLSYTGRSGQAGAFTPVNPATLPPDISPAVSQAVPAPGPAPVAEQPSGAVAPQLPKRTAPNASPAATPQARPSR